MSAAVDFTYQYAFPSAFELESSGPRLRLATCTPNQPNPYFFDGVMREPRIVGDMMLVLSDVVRTHFFLPRPPLMDPVLTSSESMLRLEGFSGCCGVYARVALASEAFDGEILGRLNDQRRLQQPHARRADEDSRNGRRTFGGGAGRSRLEREGQKTVERKSSCRFDGSKASARSRRTSRR